MLGWAMGWVLWFTWRLAVTVACLLTIQNVAHQEGHYIETRTLFIAGFCAILGIRVWMPFKQVSEKDHDN